MGEVNQGPISVPGERVTILEAIGLAGGINDFGMKNSVKVMREVDGKREAGYVDISSKDLFESPYYNLMQNDVVVVDPVNGKQKKRTRKWFTASRFRSKPHNSDRCCIRVFQSE